MLNRNYDSYVPKKYRDLIDCNGAYIEGIWRNNCQNNDLANVVCAADDGTYEGAKHCRDILKDLVNSPYGSVSWQQRAAYVDASI